MSDACEQAQAAFESARASRVTAEQAVTTLETKQTEAREHLSTWETMARDRQSTHDEKNRDAATAKVEWRQAETDFQTAKKAFYDYQESHDGQDDEWHRLKDIRDKAASRADTLKDEYEALETWRKDAKTLLDQANTEVEKAKVALGPISDQLRDARGKFGEAERAESEAARARDAACP